MSHRPRLIRARGAAVALAASFAFLVVPAAAQAQTVDLGSAGNFVVLGGAGVTNDGPSVLDGDLGGTAASGFEGPPQGKVNGETHIGDSIFDNAQNDLTNAFNDAAGAECPAGNDLTGQDLGDVGDLTPGVFCFDSSAGLTGNLTLDAEGDDDAVFIFQIGSDLTTATGSSIDLINGASPCNVFFQVGSSATLNAGTEFQGNILAQTAITLGNGVDVKGRLLARDAEITLLNDRLDNSDCTDGDRGSDDSGNNGSKGSDNGGSDNGTPVSSTAPTPSGTATLRRAPRLAGSPGIRVTVPGTAIGSVVFGVNGRPVPSLNGSPFDLSRSAAPGRYTITALVTFTDGTPSKRLRIVYRVSSPRGLRPPPGRQGLTG